MQGVDVHVPAVVACGPAPRLFCRLGQPSAQCTTICGTRSNSLFLFSEISITSAAARRLPSAQSAVANPISSTAHSSATERFIVLRLGSLNVSLILCEANPLHTIKFIPNSDKLFLYS